jgi:hypothetical protein
MVHLLHLYLLRDVTYRLETDNSIMFSDLEKVCSLASGMFPPAPPGTRIAYSRGEFQFGELRVPSVSVATPIATKATLVAAANWGSLRLSRG